MVYALFRAKAIAIQRAACAADDESVEEAVATIAECIEEIKRSLERVRLIRTEHTKVVTAISQAGGYVDEISNGIAASVAAIMEIIDGLTAEPGDLAAGNRSTAPAPTNAKLSSAQRALLLPRPTT